MSQRTKKKISRIFTITIMLMTVTILSGIPNVQAAITGTLTSLETVPNVVGGTNDQTDVTTLTLPNVTASTLPTPTFAGGGNVVTNNVPTPTFAGGGNVVTNNVPTPTFAGGVTLVTNNVPTPTFAGGVTTVTGGVPTPTFAGGVTLVTSTVPAINFAGGVNGVAATATSTIPAALAATATDRSVTIDGVVIPLGNVAQTAIQIATTIAGTDFSGGTSYVANGAYTVANGGTATLTFTRTATGIGGNNGLVIADANYTTVNAVAATAISTIPAALAATATDQSVTIDGVVIPLGNVAQTAIQIATTIAGTDFSGGTSYVANGAYTVANGGTATLTFTRTATGIGGNNGLVIADANYTTVNAVAATAISTIPAALAATATDQSVTIDGVVIPLGNVAQTAIQIATTIATTDFSGGTSYIANGAYTVANGGTATLTFTRTATGIGGNNGLVIADANYTTVNAVAATATSTIPAALAATATDQSVTIDGVVIPLGNVAQTAIQIATTIAGTDFSGGTSYVANGAYTVANGGTATLTFTRTATGIGGNNGVVIADANYTTVNEVKASRVLTVNSLPTALDTITIGDCVVTFGDYGDDTDEVNCTDNVATVSRSTAVATPRTAGQIAVVLQSLTNLAEAATHGALTVSAPSGTTIGFVTTGSETSASVIAFTDGTTGAAISSNIPTVGVVLVTSTVPAITFAGGVDLVTSTVPAITFAGGIDLVTNSVPAITFAGGVDLVTNSVPAITFAGGITAAAATATSTIPAALAAAATDQSITIDGVVIPLGNVAQTAVQIATTIAGTNFAAGTSYLADGAYTVTNVGGASATLTFTRTVAGTAGNVALVLADANYTTTNGVAATATSTIPAALAAAASDQSITIDGVVIPLGNVAQTAIQIANTIAGTNFAAGTSYVANGAYTVANGGTATLTFTRTATGAGGNAGLAVADSAYTTVNGVAATATSTIPAVLAAAASDQSITIDGVVIPLGNVAQTAIQIANTIAGTNFAAGTSYVANGAYTVANGGTATLTFTRTATGAGGNAGLAVADSAYTTVNAAAATATSVIPAALAAAASDQSITIDGVVIPLGNAALTDIQLANTIVATNFAAGTSYVANGAYTVANGGTATLTFTRTATGAGGNAGLAVADSAYTTVNAAAATATSVIPAALAAAASDQSITIDGVVIPLGNAALTDIQLANTIVATNFAAGTSYVANGAYTVANGGTATLTFTRTATGPGGNAGLVVADSAYTTVNAAAATATSTVPSGIGATATDQSITLDGVAIALGAVALTDVQVASIIAGTDFSGGASYLANGAYTVANGGTATLTFTRTVPGAGGNVGLVVADPNYGTTAQVNTITIGGTVDTDDTFTAALPGPVNAIYTVLITDTTTNDIATGLNNAIQASAGYAGQAFTSAAVGSDVVLTAKVAGTGFVQTSSNTNRVAVAQVVTFTPAAVTLGETYRGTLNATDYDYNVAPGDAVSNVTANLAPLMDANAVIGCVDTGPGTTITCTADVAGTAFTYGATVVDITPPTITAVDEYDMDNDGAIDETLLTFSENITDATINAGDLLLAVQSLILFGESLQLMALIQMWLMII